MLIISHRGNLFGKNKKLENNPDHILNVIEMGFDVEVDIWMISDQFYLGHDYPEYKIKKCFLNNKNIWFHAKNIQSLEYMISQSINCFWHENDKFTITSFGKIWCYPNFYSQEGILVLKDFELPNKKCYGVCTDYPVLVKKKYGTK